MGVVFFWRRRIRIWMGVAVGEAGFVSMLVSYDHERVVLIFFGSVWHWIVSGGYC
ncbi:hypothetical protein DSUL_50357 [Desulfovibrionales bacterium]